jgi:hypothetical protein
MPIMPPVELTVWLGKLPVIVTLVPATREGVGVPVPPFATGSGEVIEIFGAEPPEDANGEDAVTPVTVPPAVEDTVWLGNDPVTVTLVPATSDGVVVPVPPFMTGRGDVIVMLGVAPPDDASGEEAVTPATVPPPLPLELILQTTVSPEPGAE